MKTVPALSIFILLICIAGTSNASKLVKVRPVDYQCLVLHWQDGMVVYNWDDTMKGSCNGWDAYYAVNWHLCPDKNQYVPFESP